jgi:hypothetical protein
MSRTTFRTWAAVACAALLSGCSEAIREGRSPVQAMVTSIEAAPGAEPNRFGGTLSSDVLTLVKKDENGVKVKVPTIFSDAGRVVVTVALKNPGVPGSPATPTAMNDVTFTRYRVVYTRADGRNTPGVDVPHPFDSAVTFTSRPGTPGQAGFELVRITAKEEAPLRSLCNANQSTPGCTVVSHTFITTIADVTFYGQDRAGNEVTAGGSIGITFGDFGDPE